MPLKAPSWWYAKTTLLPVLLAPAAFVWDAATRLRWALTRPARAGVPVICIGNFTAGGAGKTPTAIAVARLLSDAGERPVFLTRGFGGTVKGPHLVDTKRDRARDVGDEPLLLARVAPTVVSADKAPGAALAQKNNATIIVMDDGFQNPRLTKDLSLIVVDRASGVGNNRVMPAGPLRAGLGFQFTKAHALVLVGNGRAADGIAARAQRAAMPVLDAEILPRDDTGWLRGKPVVAFTGIGNPDKFFHMIERLGCRLLHRAAYPDHHPFSSQDEDELLGLAAQHGAQLVTTQKDMVRLEGPDRLERLGKAARALPVELHFKDLEKARRLLAGVLKTS